MGENRKDAGLCPFHRAQDLARKLASRGDVCSVAAAALARSATHAVEGSLRLMCDLLDRRLARLAAREETVHIHIKTDTD